MKVKDAYMQAFPFIQPIDNDDAVKAYHPGITLRDYFAAKAMAVILASQYEDGIYVGDLDNDSEDVCAISAYKMADAMLSERESC